MSNDQFKQRLQLGMVIAVIAWGVYLAIGAVRGPRDFGEYKADYRKGLIILTVTACFVACWAAAYVASRRKSLGSAASAATNEVGTANRWNFSSAFGFLLASAATGAMATAAWGGWRAPGWAFASMFGVAAASAIASIIGLSNPTRAGGRWLGLAGLGLLAAGFVIGFYVQPLPA